MTPRTVGTVFTCPRGIKSSLDSIALDYSLVKSSTAALEPTDGRHRLWRCGLEKQVVLMHKSLARHVSAAKQSITQDMVSQCYQRKNEESTVSFFLFHQQQSSSTLLQQNKCQTIKMHLKNNWGGKNKYINTTVLSCFTVHATGIIFVQQCKMQ